MVAYETGVLAAQSLGAEPGTVKVVSQVALVNTGTEPPYKDTYAVSTVPIIAGENSYEAFFKIPVDADSLTVGTFKVYLISALPTGITLKYKSNWTGGTSAFTTPTKATSSVATTTIPVSLPAGANLSIENSIATTKTLPFLTDYIVLQLQTTASAADGDSSLTLYVQYADGSANTYTGFIPLVYSIASATTETNYNIQGIYNDSIDIIGLYPDEGSE